MAMPPNSDITNTEEDIKKTIQKLEPNDIIDPEEIATKFSEITEAKAAAAAIPAANILKNTPTSSVGETIDKAKSTFGLLSKPNIDSSSDNEASKDKAEKIHPYIDPEDTFVGFID